MKKESIYIVGKKYTDTPIFHYQKSEILEFVSEDETLLYFKPLSKNTLYLKLSNGTVPFQKNCKFYEIKN